jgi:hypothetical protein
MFFPYHQLVGGAFAPFFGYQPVSSAHPPSVVACGYEPEVKKMREALLRSELPAFPAGAAVPQ